MVRLRRKSLGGGEIPRRRRQPMRFVKHREGPRSAGAGYLSAHVSVVREEIEARDPYLYVGMKVARIARDFRRQDTRADTEEILKLFAPFFNEVRGHHDDRPALYQALTPPFDQIHPGHNRLAGAGLVGEEKPQPRLRHHVLEDRFVLMGEGFQGPRSKGGGT